MVRPGGDDNLSFDITADGGQARKEIKGVLDRIRSLGTEAATAGKKVDSATVETARSYRHLAEEIAKAQRAEDDLTRSAESQRAARAKANTAVTNSGVASATAPHKIAKSAADADLATERVKTEQIRQQNSLREQGNRALVAENQIGLINDRRQDIAAAREERQQKATQTNQQRIRSEMERTFAQKERDDAKAVRAEEKRRSQMDRAFQQQEREQARATAAAIRDTERIQRATDRANQQRIRDNTRAAQQAQRTADQQQRAAERQGKIYASYMEGQYKHDNRDSDLKNVNSTRYALYDIASTAAIVGTAFVGAGAASAVFATKFQSEFSSVQRAAELTGSSIANVRNDLVDLTTSIPTNFADVTKIATLGAQMNINEDSLDSFTEVISKFSATTNASVEETAQSFGRISNLLDVPASDFDKLGASIYEVGIKSVATETEILSTTQQIAGATAAYGFAAQDVVGLGAAFASLAIAPEAARGSVTRIFGDIEKSVSEGGDALTSYSRLMGLSAEETAKLWKQDPAAFFRQLIDGLSQSNDLLSDLSSIGANDVRDVNLLQRLAGNPELLTNAMKIANNAFDEGTALEEGYAVTADTVASKLQVLMQSFQALAASAGGPFLGVLTLGIGILQHLIDLLQQNSWAVTFLAVLALIIGSIILFKGATAAAMAGLLAMRFVLEQLGTQATLTGINLRSLGILARQVGTEMGLTTTSVRSFSGAVAGAGVAMKAFGKATLVLAALTIAFELLGAAQSKVEEMFASNSDRAEKYFGDTAGFSEAIAADTKTWNENGRAVSTFTTAVTDSGKAQSAAEQAASQWLGVQGRVAPTTDAATDAVTDQTTALGDNAQAWIRKALSEQQGIQDLANDPKLIATFKELGGTVSGFIAAGLKGDSSGYLDKLLAEGEKKIEEAYARSGGARSGETIALQNQIDKLESALGPAAEATDSLVASQQEGAKTSAFLGDAASQAGGEIEDMGNDALSSSDKLQQLQDAVDAAFSAINKEADFGGALQSLYEGIDEGGNYFGAFSEAGRKNMGNLQDTILATADYASSLGLNVNDSLVPLFANLQAQGVDTTTLLKKLASDPIMFQAGLDPSALLASLNGITAGTTSFSGAQSYLGMVMSEYQGAVSRASAANKSMSSSTKETQEEVRTLSDYVSDLGSAFDKTFDFRFGSAQALDDIASKWNDIANENEEARTKLRDYLIELQGMQADKDKLEFFYNVAVVYGDSLRANDIAAQIAKANADIADKQKEVDETSTLAQRSLLGNSDAAIENRGTLLDLTKGYADYVTSLANSGMSQDQLQTRVEQLRAEFINQATQLGYNRDDVNAYADSFTDLGRVIQLMPKNITVTASADPAQRAIDEFLARNRNGQGASSGINVPVSASFDGAALAKAARGVELVGQMNKLQEQLTQAYANTRGNSNGLTGSLEGRIYSLKQTLNSGNYARGGFVPWAEPAGNGDNGFGLLPNGNTVGLRGGEPIITTDARRQYGDQMFQDINALKYKPQQSSTVIVQAPAAQSSATPQIMVLDAAQYAGLQAAMAAGRVVKIDKRALADANDQTNATYASLGKG